MAELSIALKKSYRNEGKITQFCVCLLWCYLSGTINMPWHNGSHCSTCTGIYCHYCQNCSTPREEMGFLKHWLPFKHLN